MTAALPLILPTRLVEKPWGRAALPAPFAVPEGAGPIGEIWFEPGGYDALLVKYIFTSEHLSVQVHPSDEQTLAAGMGAQGKEECWLILDREPGARIAIGFQEDISPERMRAAAVDGSIEELLDWHEVEPGDFFYIPANTVHAIGAGISLVEIQQNSDITYRLYDYGRPRELHLEDGMAVAEGRPYCPSQRRKAGTGRCQTLVDGPLFRLDEVHVAPDAEVAGAYGDSPLLVIPLDGSVMIGAHGVAAGQCAVARRLGDVDFTRTRRCLIAQHRCGRANAVGVAA